MAKPRTSPQPPKQRTRGLSRYKRSETARLLRAATDAGHTVCGLEVDPDTGKLRLLFDSGKGEPNNNLDSWLKKKDAHQT
jgi:hypothetical protein